VALCRAEVAEGAKVGDDSPPLGAAIGAGIEVASLLAGGVFFSHDTDPTAQKRGLYLAAGGLALAPIVSHAVDRRWRRAVAFGLASLATTAAAVVDAEEQRVFDPSPALENRRRTPFVVLLTVALFVSTAGVVDSFLSDRPDR
jgi:hypothetical protein